MLVSQGKHPPCRRGAVHLVGVSCSRPSAPRAWRIDEIGSGQRWCRLRPRKRSRAAGEGGLGRRRRAPRHAQFCSVVARYRIL